MAKKLTDIESKKKAVARAGRCEAYANKVGMMFSETVNSILSLHKSVPELKDGQMFSFDDESVNKQNQVTALLRRLHSNVVTAIRKDMGIEWDKANDEADSMIVRMFGEEVTKNPAFAGWMERNHGALNAFASRSEKGLKLSDRIWRDVKQLREEMEVAMTVSIGEGESASSMSRKVKQYLNDPDLMFRRFRYKIGEDEEGKPVYGKKWKKRVKDEATGTYKWIDYDKDSYKTGRGIYKSASKNAMRVTRTETNIAYRRADNKRWLNMDFVLGYRINIAHNHPEKDICDTLQGDYPKDFVFDGWHPQCFCYCTPILIDEEEMVKMMIAKRDGKEYTPKSKEIKDVPANFKKWVEDNADKIDEMRENGTEPYFLRHNKWMVDEILNPQQSVQSMEQKRQKTQEQIDDIKKRWAERKAINKFGMKILDTMNGIDGVDTSMLQEAIHKADRQMIEKEAKKLADIGKSIKQSLPYIDDTFANVKKYGLDTIRKVNQAITNTIDSWLNKYSYNDIYQNPNHAIAKLKFEIDNLESNKKYTTWELATKSYKKLLTKVEDVKEWKNILDESTSLTLFQTKSKDYNILADELNKLIGVKKDKEKAKSIIAKLKTKKAAMEKDREKRIVGKEISKVLNHKPNNINNDTLNEHQEWMGGDERVEWISKNCKEINDKTAIDYERAVYGFTYQWDYEIRQVQEGINVVSRKGHTLNEICKKAIDIEDYIARAPKWKGGKVLRGMSLSKQDIDRIRVSLKSGDYSMRGTSSWSTDELTALSFSNSNLGKIDKNFHTGEILTERVVFVCENQKRGTTIRHLSKFENENEVLCSKMSKYRFIREEEKNGIIYFYIDCIEP